MHLELPNKHNKELIRFTLMALTGLVDEITVSIKYLKSRSKFSILPV